MNYCSDCCNLESGIYDKSSGKWSGEKNGMFRCMESRKSGYDKVSACMRECPAFRPVFNSRRSSGDCQSIYSASSRHGYYLTSFICDTLNLEESGRYKANFDYLKNTMLPLISGGLAWIKEYDESCSEIIKNIEASGNAHEICVDLNERYLRPFNELFEQSQIDKAFDIYDKMFQETKSKYCELGQKMN